LPFVADAIRIVAFLFQQKPFHSHLIFVICRFSEKLIADILVPSALVGSEFIGITADI